MLPLLRVEAKERQKQAGCRGYEGGRGNKKDETLPLHEEEGFPKREESAETAARMVGVGKGIIYEAPEPFHGEGASYFWWFTGGSSGPQSTGQIVQVTRCGTGRTHDVTGAGAAGRVVIEYPLQNSRQ